jgi:hypothetical protein
LALVVLVVLHLVKPEERMEAVPQRFPLLQQVVVEVVVETQIRSILGLLAHPVALVVVALLGGVVAPVHREQPIKDTAVVTAMMQPFQRAVVAEGPVLPVLTVEQ